MTVLWESCCSQESRTLKFKITRPESKQSTMRRQLSSWTRSKSKLKKRAEEDVEVAQNL